LKAELVSLTAHSISLMHVHKGESTASRSEQLCMQVEFAKQALDWLRHTSSHVSKADCDFLLDMFTDGATRRLSSPIKRIRSDAMLSVMMSGLSIADSSALMQTGSRLRSRSKVSPEAG
jgi:hypothetical protein